MNQPQLPQFTLITNSITIIEIVFALIVMMIVLPKIFKEASVKDDLRDLRKYLLESGISIFVLLLISLFTLTVGFILPREYRIYLIGTLLVVFGLMADIFALSKLKIYTLHYKQETLDTIERRKRLDRALKQIERKKRKGGGE